MSDTKQNGHTRHPARTFEEDLSSGNGNVVIDAPQRKQPKDAGRSGREVTSWDAYRNWLTKVQAPEQRRSFPDPALFSFKGYRSWAEKIRRDWKPEE